MKHLRALELITVIAATGSLRKSAAQLNIVPSALTRQLQELEHEFGAPLFDRAQQGMRPTAAGELVLRHARTQLAGHDLLLSQLADLAGGRRGHVTIACSQAFAHEVLPAEIAAYQAQHPRIAFSILVRDHAEAVAALTSYEAELALVLQPPPTAGLSVLFKDEHFLCALMRPDHPLGWIYAPGRHAQPRSAPAMQPVDPGGGARKAMRRAGTVAAEAGRLPGMANPLTKKNPFLSLWLSAANAWAGAARGAMTAAAKRQMTAALKPPPKRKPKRGAA